MYRDTFVIVWLLLKLALIECQVDLGQYFSHCQKTEETFDGCIKQGLNGLRPYFISGLPDYGILPFDPFYASEVPQKRKGSFYDYKLILRNVTEAGWTVSEIKDLKIDSNRHSMTLTHFFPDKRLKGWYEFEGTMFNNKVSNKGSWSLNLFNYTQIMTITRKPVGEAYGNAGNEPSIKVKVNIRTCEKLELHIGHLVGGRTIVENMLDWIINRAWQPGFVVLSPLINDLVSTAFTELFNKNFQNFPFEMIFPH